MIYINGDSWSRNLWIDWSPEDWCWGKQLSNNLGHAIQNEAAGCGSNPRIVDKMVMAYAQGHRYDLAIIGLTGAFRWYLPSTLFSYWNLGPTVIEERKYKVDNEIHQWVINNCLDHTNMIMTYYKTIWHIHEICSSLFKCPVLFFNAFDQSMYEFHNKIFCHKDNLCDWTRSSTHGLIESDAINFTKMMCFYQDQSRYWLLDMQTWSSRLDHQGDIDGPKDRDPGHPSRIGHGKIASYVQETIAQRLPNLYEQLVRA